MKILLITNATNLSGGVFQMFELAKGLIKRGCDVAIACHPESRVKLKADGENILCHEIVMKSDIDVSAMYRLYKLLRREKFDVVHAHHPRAHMIAMAASLFARVPVFVVSRRVSFSIKEGKNFLSPFKYRSSRIDMILPVCDAIGDLLDAEGVARKKIKTIYSGTDPARFNPDTVQSLIREELGISDDDTVITKIAHYSPWKGYDCLFRAARLVLAHTKNAKFIIAGSSTSSEEVVKMVKNMGLEKSFFCLGERADVPEILKASDIVVNAAHEGEGLSGALREAAFMGVPIVAADVSGNKEICIDGRTGYLFPKKDDIALSNALITLIQDGDSRRRMGAAGRDYALKELTIDVMVERTLDTYRELLDKKSA